MSKGGKPNRGVFDVERIREIVELMEQHDLNEVDLQQGDDKIKLKRGAEMVPMAAAPSYAPPPPPAAGGSSATPAAASGQDDGTITINAPMVGTFYIKPNPESDAFVQVGSVVNEETVVCIVEAMKVFNEIPAECRGTIVEILAEDQQPVDFGKPLFRVKPSA
ncbi:MAG: acetyl-CoA carboxylase biotin carboxyl carrier protein [Pirellulaceae bacterium]|nr:acetyl-CoA carboxylase biotin carboxyl carrier protein [Pirellulaceae bacterium]